MSIANVQAQQFADLAASAAEMYSCFRLDSNEACIRKRGWSMCAVEMFGLVKKVRTVEAACRDREHVERIENPEMRIERWELRGER